MQSRTGAVALALATALMVGACGGGDDEQKKKDQAVARALAKSKADVKEAATTFGQAGDDACETFSDDFLERQFEADGSRCENVYQALEDDRPKVRVGTVRVTGRKATAQATIGGEPGEAELVKEGGEWKVDRFDPERSNQKDLPEVRGTSDAFLTAVREGNGTVFCGLMSEEFAQELLKVDEGGVGKCAIDAEKINFSGLQARLRGVTTQKVESNNELRRAKATLSNGAALLMRKPEDRWVINDIVR